MGKVERFCELRLEAKREAEKMWLTMGMALTAAMGVWVEELVSGSPEVELLVPMVLWGLWGIRKAFAWNEKDAKARRMGFEISSKLAMERVAAEMWRMDGSKVGGFFWEDTVSKD